MIQIFIYIREISPKVPKTYNFPEYFLTGENTISAYNAHNQLSNTVVT